MSNDIEECFTAARQFVEARFASYGPEACAILIAAYVQATGGKAASKGKKKEAEPLPEIPEAESEWDQIARFVKDACVIDPAAQTRTRVIYSHYLQWARRNDIARPINGNMLTNRLVRIGYQRHKDEKHRYLIGVRCNDG